MKVPKAKKLPSGNWFCRVRVNGKDIGVTRTSEREAVADAMAIKAGTKEAEQNVSTITLGQAYDRYIETRNGVLSPSTIAGYKKLRRNTLQELMENRINALTNEKIQSAISGMSRDGKSPKYIRNAHGLLSAVLREYRPDFVLRTRLSQKEKIEQRMISDSEIDAIIRMCRGAEIEIPVLLALWLGMRMSEIRGIKFSDISNGRLHVQRAVVEDEHRKAVVKGTKSFSGDRMLDLPPYIDNLIKSLPYSDGFIIRSSGHAIYARFSRMLEKYGIRHCKFHDLRHANAAVMIRLGVESKYAQERNGWATDDMYKQVYGYVMDDKMKSVSNCINQYFENKMDDSE